MCIEAGERRMRVRWGWDLARCGSALVRKRRSVEVVVMKN